MQNWIQNVLYEGIQALAQCQEVSNPSTTSNYAVKIVSENILCYINISCHDFISVSSGPRIPSLATNIASDPTTESNSEPFSLF